MNPIALVSIEPDQHAGNLEADIGLHPRAGRAQPEDLLSHIRLCGREQNADRAEEDEPRKNAARPRAMSATMIQVRDRP